MTIKSGSGVRLEERTMELELLLSPVPLELYSNRLLNVSAVIVKSRSPAPLVVYGSAKL